MELVNQTPLTTALAVSKPLGGDPLARRGLLVAKATYGVGREGVSLVSADPFPVSEEDVETELGVLPADTHPRAGAALEVAVLGAAYAPYGRPTAEMSVELRIGERTWTMHVSGDRQWIGAGPDARPSPPVPFARMPLTWERAYGGRTDLWLDRSTILEVVEPQNPLGRGFDPEPHARGLASTLGAPEGFPWWERTRPLPNLEHPSQRMIAYADRPTPYCWAPRPITMTRPPGPPKAELERVVRTGSNIVQEGLCRVIPELVLPSAPLGATVCVTGMRASGDWTFTLPRVGVQADYVIDERVGSRALVPQVLVLLPEQSRFYLVFRADFWMKVSEDDERSFRLRLTGEGAA